MDKIIWLKENHIGIDIIDYYNSKLIEKINELLEIEDKFYLSGNFESFFIFLLDYAYYCFKIEEKYFDECTYPDKNEHIIEHRKFIKDIIEFQYDFLKTDIFFMDNVILYIKSWIENHILIKDKEILENLNKNICKQK